MILLVISVASRVFAADGTIQPIVQNNTNVGSNINTIEPASNTANQVNAAAPINNTVVNNTNTNTLTNSMNTATNTNKAATNSNLPYAGLQSNSVIIFLLVATSISAIYTYKKVKEYNL